MLDAIRARLDDSTARGLAHAIGVAVADGALSAGDRLPPIRVVAREIGMSPTTVSAAWSMLSRSGAIHTDGRHGTFIAVRSAAGPQRYRRAVDRVRQFDLDLSTGVPDRSLLPDISSALHRVHADVMPQTYLDEPVAPGLEACLRGDWPYPAEAITIVDGAMDALDLISRSWIQFGDRIAVENPCFPPLLDLLESAGAQVVPIELDDDGPLAAGVAAALSAGCRTVILQPRAQNPTGASLTDERAVELARILSGSDVLVVENDSMGAVASTPLVSLGTMLPRQTLHIRSFSKSYGPDLRLAAIGGPADLVDRIVDRRHLGQGWTSWILQRLLLDLLTHRSSSAQVARARAEYAARRASLVDDLAELGVTVGGKDGLNVWVPVTDESAALVSLATSGIGVAPGSPFVIGTVVRPHIRVTSGLLTDRFRFVAEQLAGASGWQRFRSPR